MKKIVVLLLILAMIGGCANKEQTEEPIISLYQHESGEITEIPLEEYLCGVVAAEMAVDWPLEALKAQAILARTFTLEKMENGGVAARGTDASTDVTEFQAYDATKVNDSVRKAVSETKGLVVQYQGELIHAWFFADGGGLTASSAAEGLAYDKEETPYIHSVEDPGAGLRDNENLEWRAQFTAEEVKEAVRQVNGWVSENIDTVAIGEKGPSGRAIQLLIQGEEVGAAAFRLAIGSEKMKSTLLDEFLWNNGELQIRGRGYGHGVGMSQWGAKAMALDGATADEIIMYFFQGVTIEQQYQ